MKTDLFVDTSGWAPFLAAKDPLHAQVADILQQAAKHGRRLITTSYVILELITLLERYRFSRARALEGINAIKATSGVLLLHVDEATDAEAWGLLEARLDKSWSLVDATSFVVMRRFGIGEALTTDHHFEQAGFMRLPA
jgi:predicted nucleic acid-binding protein